MFSSVLGFDPTIYFYPVEPQDDDDYLCERPMPEEQYDRDEDFED